MNKKGQVYIAAALILIAVIYLIVTKLNTVHQEKLETDFQKISKNYVIESNRLVNSLINSREDVMKGFTNFTLIFTGYSKAQNPNMGMVYIFKYENKIQIGNYLDTSIEVDLGENKNESLPGCYDSVSTSIEFEGLSITVGSNLGDVMKCILTKDLRGRKSITIYVDDIPYEFDLVGSRPQLMVVTRQDEKEQRQVFIERGTF